VSRRSVALLVAGVSVLVLGALLFIVPVPYAILGPGPVCNTLGSGTHNCPSTSHTTLITVSPAAADYPDPSGRLGATTVSVFNNEPSLAHAIASWFTSSEAVVPREVIVPPDQSAKQFQQQGRQEMQEAQSSAVDAAEGALGLLNVTVVSVEAGFPAAMTLRAGDVITAFDGTPIRSATQLTNLSTSNTDPNAQFTFTVLRAGVSQHITLGRKKSPQSGTLVFGISLNNVPRGVKVSVTLDPNAVGGPSAGLMLALGVYDRLTPGSLTGTTIVAGTGTIDDAGTVGAIGGIQQKMYAARHDFKARIFLAPASDCSDAKGAIPKGLQVVKVSTFDDALHALAAVRAGNTAGLPHC
jgi:PDZ domain-containing protein